jgi:hypothetical protein
MAIPAVIVRALIAAAEMVSTEVAITRMAVSLVKRGLARGIAKRAVGRALRRRGRVGILDTIASGVRKGASTLERTPFKVPSPSIPSTPHWPVIPYEPPSHPISPIPGPERIVVPPHAIPTTPLSQAYQPSVRPFGTESSTQPVEKVLPQPAKESSPNLTNLLRSDIALNALTNIRALSDKWLPGIRWTGTVSAVGFKTTPTRTVVHYALAVAFGLVKQQRVSGVALSVDIDYETNHVVVIYTSNAYWLTELITLGIYNVNGAILPSKLAEDFNKLKKKLDDLPSRSLMKGFIKGPQAGFVELGSGAVELAGDALALVLKAYGNLGRMLGPLAIYDMGEETLFGGRPSVLLQDRPNEPEPFKSMHVDENGYLVPLLTRLPAPNPQPPVPPGEDPSTGYSVDLRSLVAQALYDPGVAPPIPDTNVSLPVFH